MDFKYFCLKTDLLEEFDSVITEFDSLNEEHIGDLDIANVIMTGLDKIETPSVKSIIATFAVVAKLMGKKVRDVIKLFSNDGFSKIRGFIENDLIGSEEIQYILRMKDDPKRYQGYKGLENYIRDMQENNPKLMDSLKKAVDRIIS